MEEQAAPVEPTALNGSAKLLTRPPLGANATIRVQPGRKDGEEDPAEPVYTLRVWTERMKLGFRHDLRAAAAFISPEEIVRTLRQAVTDLLPADEATATLATLDQWAQVPKHAYRDFPILPDLPEIAPERAIEVVEALAQGETAEGLVLAQPVEPPTDETDEARAAREVETAAVQAERTRRVTLWGEVEGIKRFCERGSAAYRAVLADADHWEQCLNYFAVKYALAGFERVMDADGKPIKFERRDSVATDRTLAAIPRRPVDHFAFLAARAIALQAPSETQRKN